LHVIIFRAPALVFPAAQTAGAKTDGEVGKKDQFAFHSGGLQYLFQEQAGVALFSRASAYPDDFGHCLYTPCQSPMPCEGTANDANCIATERSFCSSTAEIGSFGVNRK